MKQQTKKVRITERGFAGHFCGSSRCLFHRNTLIEYGKKRIIVSTVGNYQPNHTYNEENKSEHEIGCKRFYETMAFKAIKKGIYWEIDENKEIDFKSPWSISEIDYNADYKADIMHDKVVKEICKTL